MSDREQSSADRDMFIDLQPRELTTADVILERIKVQASGKIGAQVLHDMRMREHYEPLAIMADDLTMQLVTYVMAHKEGEDMVSVPFRKRVDHPQQDVRIDAPLTAWALFAVGIIGAVLMLADVIGGVLGYVPGALFTLAFFVAAAPRRTTIKAQSGHVSGTVEVDVKKYNSFPQNNEVFNNRFGEPVRLVMYDTRAMFDDR
jgi:hypothetical protein